MSSASKKPQWDDLRVLLSVLRTGSFSAAADELGVEQSTISRRIARLEQECGHSLFDRQPSGPQPTELAQRMRLHAERVEAEVQAISDLAHGEDGAIAGRVQLAVTESFAVHVLVPHLLPELRARYPELAIDLVASTTATDLSRRDADLAVRFFRPAEGDLITTRVATLPTAIIARRSYAEAHPSDATKLDWLVLEIAPGVSPDRVYLAEHVERAPAMMTNSHIIQIEAVRAGLGVALLARAHLALDPELVTMELALPPAPPVEVWLATPRALRRVPRVRAVWEFLSDKLGALEQV